MNPTTFQSSVNRAKTLRIDLTLPITAGIHNVVNSAYRQCGDRKLQVHFREDCYGRETSMRPSRVTWQRGGSPAK